MKLIKTKVFEVSKIVRSPLTRFEITNAPGAVDLDTFLSLEVIASFPYRQQSHFYLECRFSLTTMNIIHRIEQYLEDILRETSKK